MILVATVTASLACSGIAGGDHPPCIAALSNLPCPPLGSQHGPHFSPGSLPIWMDTEWPLLNSSLCPAISNGLWQRHGFHKAEVCTSVLIHQQGIHWPSKLPRWQGVGAGGFSGSENLCGKWTQENAQGSKPETLKARFEMVNARAGTGC